MEGFTGTTEETDQDRTSQGAKTLSEDQNPPKRAFCQGDSSPEAGNATPDIEGQSRDCLTDQRGNLRAGEMARCVIPEDSTSFLAYIGMHIVHRYTYIKSI